MNDRAGSITFFFPYREVSGVPVLFLRMAEFISARYNVDTRLIDYPDGYMGRSRDPALRNVSLIPFRDGVPLQVPDETILIMQSVLPYTMRPELRIHSSTRIVFWTLHPLNLMQTLIPTPFFRHMQSRSATFHRVGMRLLFPKQRRGLQNLVQTLQARRSLLFMDGETLRATSSYVEAPIHHPIFIPVPSDEAGRNLRLESGRRPTTSIDIAWIGRLADFKIHILVRTLTSLRDYAKAHRLPIAVHVIGEGPLACKIASFDASCPYFTVKRVMTLGRSELAAYLINHVDVVAAMGASALEGARLGLPTILLDLSYGPVADGYRFRWIFESENYNLGEVIDARHFQRGNDSLGTKMRAVLADYAGLSQRTFDYYSKNHSIDRVATRFLAALETASFTYSDFDPRVFSKGTLRNVYERARDYFKTC